MNTKLLFFFFLSTNYSESVTSDLFKRTVQWWRKAWVVSSCIDWEIPCETTPTGRELPIIHIYCVIMSPAGLEPIWQSGVASRETNLATNWAIPATFHVSNIFFCFYLVQCKNSFFIITINKLWRKEFCDSVAIKLHIYINLLLHTVLYILRIGTDRPDKLCRFWLYATDPSLIRVYAHCCHHRDRVMDVSSSSSSIKCTWPTLEHCCTWDYVQGGDNAQTSDGKTAEFYEVSLGVPYCT